VGKLSEFYSTLYMATIKKASHSQPDEA